MESNEEDMESETVFDSSTSKWHMYGKKLFIIKTFELNLKKLPKYIKKSPMAGPTF